MLLREKMSPLFSSHTLKEHKEGQAKEEVILFWTKLLKSRKLLAAYVLSALSFKRKKRLTYCADVNGEMSVSLTLQRRCGEGEAVNISSENPHLQLVQPCGFNRRRAPKEKSPDLYSAAKCFKR